jgi:hypothetical protein
VRCREVCHLDDALGVFRVRRLEIGLGHSRLIAVGRNKPWLGQETGHNNVAFPLFATCLTILLSASDDGGSEEYLEPIPDPVARSGDRPQQRVVG